MSNLTFSYFFKTLTATLICFAAFLIPEISNAASYSQTDYDPALTVIGMPWSETNLLKDEDNQIKLRWTGTTSSVTVLHYINSTSTDFTGSNFNFVLRKQGSPKCTSTNTFPAQTEPRQQWVEFTYYFDNCTEDFSNDDFGDVGGSLDGQSIGTAIECDPSPDNCLKFNPYFIVNKGIASRTPVLIVPGVVGTDIQKNNEKLWLDLGHNLSDVGDNFMDPLQFKNDLTMIDNDLALGEVIRDASMTPATLVNYDYTKGLIDLFVSSSVGYEENTDLFTFPYDWRYGVSGKFSDGKTNADLLAEKIQAILQQTGSNAVDIVAHSTGGLLVKKYVVDHPSDHHIGKAVFVGVPNEGAPKAVKVLLQGDNFGIPWLADDEMKKIGQNIPVTYDLAPSQKYFDQNGSFFQLHNPFASVNEIDQDFNFEQTLQKLKDKSLLNSQAADNAKNLRTLDFDNFDLRSQGMDLYSIAGCKSATISKVVANVQADSPDYSFDVLKLTSGDGTVPLTSASSLAADTGKVFYSLKADHGKMPSANGIRQKIVNIISGSSQQTPDVISQQDLNADPSQCKISGHWWQVFSPVDIVITDQDGNVTQKASDGSVQNDIPGADFEIWGEHKFVFVPTDGGNNYSLKITGTGSGTFTLKKKIIDNDQVVQTLVFANIPVNINLAGKIDFGSDSLSLDSNGDGTFEQTVQPSAILDAEQSLDSIAPASTSTLTGTAVGGQNFEGSVSISLQSNDQVIAGQEDQVSGILETQYQLDGGDYQSFSTSTPIFVDSEGAHTLKFFSTDKAGNNEPIQTLNFTIAAASVGSSSPASPQTGSGGGTGSNARVDGVGFSFGLPTGKVLGTSTKESLLDQKEMAHTEGSLVVDATGTVYLITGHAMHPFTSAAGFLHLGYKFQNVAPVSPADKIYFLGMPM